MSKEQERFDDLMKRVIKVSPEELKRRLAESKPIKSGAGRVESAKKEARRGSSPK